MKLKEYIQEIGYDVPQFLGKVQGMYELTIYDTFEPVQDPFEIYLDNQVEHIERYTFFEKRVEYDDRTEHFEVFVYPFNPCD